MPAAHCASDGARVAVQAQLEVATCNWQCQCQIRAAVAAIGVVGPSMTSLNLLSQAGKALALPVVDIICGTKAAWWAFPTFASLCSYASGNIRK